MRCDPECCLEAQFCILNFLIFGSHMAPKLSVRYYALKMQNKETDISEMFWRLSETLRETQTGNK